MRDGGKGGSIVNIASILGMRVAGHVSSYVASKGGLVHLTKAMALELARHDIRVNALCPGYLETELNQDFFASDAGKALIRRIPAAPAGPAGGAGRAFAAAVFRRRFIHDGLGDRRGRRSSREFALTVLSRGVLRDGLFPVARDRGLSPAGPLLRRARDPAGGGGPRQLGRAREHRPRRPGAVARQGEGRRAVVASDAEGAGRAGLAAGRHGRLLRGDEPVDLRAGLLQLGGARRRQHDGAEQDRDRRRRRSAGFSRSSTARSAAPSR